MLRRKELFEVKLLKLRPNEMCKIPKESRGRRKEIQEKKEENKRKESN